ncbi:FAD-dependent oxidoreductase [Candidatus Woesearchaeota archaeon]|nr:FAD-dependent oxidoreductase [Candidatus Woesearchaeota archaeon]
MAEEKITEGIVFESRHKYKHEPDQNKEYDTIIIGVGVAGYSSAMYASRLGLKVLMIGEQPGGTLALTGRVENYPGFVSIEGQKLTELLENHALDYDVDYLIDVVDKIKKENGFFKVFSEKKVFSTKTIILATGAQVKKLGVKGEEEFFGKGVDYCALCDAAFIKGKTIAVAGGGDSAVKEAILVTEYAKKVFIINNEKELHPEHHNQMILDEKVKQGKIEVINDNEIVEIKGKEKVDTLILKKEYQKNKELSVQGLFVYIGHIPKSELAKQIGVKLNKNQEVIIDAHSETNIKGFFAAGDVTNLDWKQAIIGVSQGVTAAYYAYQHIKKLEGDK